MFGGTTQTRRVSSLSNVEPCLLFLLGIMPSRLTLEDCFGNSHKTRKTIRIPTTTEAYDTVHELCLIGPLQSISHLPADIDPPVQKRTSAIILSPSEQNGKRSSIGRHVADDHYTHTYCSRLGLAKALLVSALSARGRDQH